MNMSDDDSDYHYSTGAHVILEKKASVCVLMLFGIYWER